MNKIVRVNDGNDSFFLTEKQIQSIILEYRNCFFNTSIPKDLDKYHTWSYGLMFEAGAINNYDIHPVVLTVNPGEMTDTDFHAVDPIPPNLMFVRARVNTWNLKLIDQIVEYYSSREVPIILTFMAYHTEHIDKLKLERNSYIYRKRTMNSYYAITTEEFHRIMDRYKDNKWVHSCGKIEGELGDTHCRFCGNCLREYYATTERLGQ